MDFFFLHIDGAEKYILSAYLSGSACTTGASLSTLLKQTNLFLISRQIESLRRVLCLLRYAYRLLIYAHFGATLFRKNSHNKVPPFDRGKAIKILHLPLNPKSRLSDPDSSNQNPGKIQIPGYLADNVQDEGFPSPSESV